MKKRMLSFFACFIFPIAICAQTEADSITLVNANWEITTLSKGVVCRKAEIPSLYNVPQHITILEIDPKYHSFDIHIHHPKAETSTEATKAGAIAAINGSYFNVRQGTSVCYLQKDKAVTDTTTASEFGLRVTGAVYIKKGKIKLIPWNKSTEQTHKARKETILASGPLMLLDGNTYDWSSCGKGFIDTKHPRSAVGISKDGKIWLIAVDGRFPGKAEGISIPELAHMIRVLGGKEALNLDGGGSTTLWSGYAPENGILNKPCDNKQYDNQGERKVANSLIVVKR